MAASSSSDSGFFLPGPCLAPASTPALRCLVRPSFVESFFADNRVFGPDGSWSIEFLARLQSDDVLRRHVRGVFRAAPRGREQRFCPVGFALVPQWSLREWLRAVVSVVTRMLPVTITIAGDDDAPPPPESIVGEDYWRSTEAYNNVDLPLGLIANMIGATGGRLSWQTTVSSSPSPSRLVVAMPLSSIDAFVTAFTPFVFEPLQDWGVGGVQAAWTKSASRRVRSICFRGLRTTPSAPGIAVRDSAAPRSRWTCCGTITPASFSKATAPGRRQPRCRSKSSTR